MILFIDTTDYNHMRFALIDPKTNKVNDHAFAIAHNESYKTLDHLNKFLKKNKLALGSTYKLPATSYQLQKVIVCTGPGAFTGTRVGVTIAQALGFANRIPIAAIPKNKVPADLSKLTTAKLTKTVSIAYTPAKLN